MQVKLCVASASHHIRAAIVLQLPPTKSLPSPYKCSCSQDEDLSEDDLPPDIDMVQQQVSCPTMHRHFLARVVAMPGGIMPGYPS